MIIVLVYVLVFVVTNFTSLWELEDDWLERCGGSIGNLLFFMMIVLFWGIFIVGDSWYLFV